MSLRDYFYRISDILVSELHSNEFLACWFSGEDSDFVQLNQNRIRQAGHVRQSELILNLVIEDRQASIQCNITANLGYDIERLKSNLEFLRQTVSNCPADPYLQFNPNIQNSETATASRLPSSDSAIKEILRWAEGIDLVGFFASGSLYRGYLSSAGQKNWYSKANFNFDWSCYLRGDKAVKSRYAGYEWSSDFLQKKFAMISLDLESLKKTPVAIKPGQYRVYLAPSAVAEVAQLLSWNCFGLKSHITKQSPLLKLAEKATELNPEVHLREDNINGLSPLFTQHGFIKPDTVALIDQGQYADCLVNSRSGKEYHHTVNANIEIPQSLTISPGTLASEDIVSALDKGIYINNLWYSNYSDTNDCRITGMTRFACFWVEHGRIQAPIEVMRFDESIYRMLGDNLLDLTQNTELILDSGTYERRSVNSMTLPGLLIEAFTLTL